MGDTTCYNVKQEGKELSPQLPPMTKEQLRAKIEAASKAMEEALAAFAEMPEGSIDVDDDLDILGNIAALEFISQDGFEDTALFGEIFDEVSSGPQVA